MSTGARRCGGLATCWEVPNNESPAGHVSLLRWLALLAITTYLLRRGKPLVYTLVPMVFMLVSTLSAMGSNLIDFWRQGEVILLGTGGGVIFVLAVWLTLEAWVAVRRYRRRPVVEDLEVQFAETGVWGLFP